MTQLGYGVIAGDSLTFGHASQDYRLRFALGFPRLFSVMDVDLDGDDTLPPPTPDLADGVQIAAFDGVITVGPISGSVAGGGWQCPLVIAKFPANFARYAGVHIYVTPYYSNEALFGELLAFRGYMRSIASDRLPGDERVRISVTSSHSLLADNQLSYGIDYYSSLDHVAPLTVGEAIAHILDAHTNLSPRSAVVVGLPDADLNALSVSAGDFAGIVKGMASAVAIEGWVFSRRDDTLWVTAHPNYLGDAYPNYAIDAMDFNDDMVFSVKLGDERPDDVVASLTVVAETSDQDQLTSRAETRLGLGGRTSLSGLRYDNFDTLDALAPRALAHANRRYRAVQLTMPLNFGFDIGDIVTLTTTIPQRDIAWVKKRFVVLDISITPDLTGHTLTTSCTLDEIIDADALLASGDIFLS